METIEIHVGEGTATLTATEGRSIRADQVDRAVKSAGFTPRGMIATVVGTFASRKDGAYLLWEESEIELVDFKDAALEESRKLRVTGKLTVHREGPSTSLALKEGEVEVIED